MFTCTTKWWCTIYITTNNVYKFLGWIQIPLYIFFSLLHINIWMKLNTNSVSCWLYLSSLEKHNQQLVFLIVTCEKQIALTANYFWMCHWAVSLLLLCAIQNMHMLEVGLHYFFVRTTFFFSHNRILLGASDEQFLFNNSMSCYNFFARGCENGLLKIFTRTLDLLALHDCMFLPSPCPLLHSWCHVLHPRSYVHWNRSLSWASCRFKMNVFSLRKT